MRLDAETILHLMQKSDAIDVNDPHQLLNAVLKLIYPLFEQEDNFTQILEDFDSEPADENLDRLHQHELNQHVLGLLKKSWDMLSLALNKTNNAAIKAACQREQALMILRLLNNNSYLFSLTDKMLGVLQLNIIGVECFSMMHAENLLSCAAQQGDLIAQLATIWRLLCLTEKRQLLQPVVLTKEDKRKMEIFHSWLTSHPRYTMQLEKFSALLTNVTRDVTNDFTFALNVLIKEHISYDFHTLITTPSLLPLTNFLRENMHIICEIDRAFRANWNENEMILVATREKQIRIRFFGEEFPLDRSQSNPLKATLPEVLLERNGSDPEYCKADFNTGKRERDPRDHFRELPILEPLAKMLIN